MTTNKILKMKSNIEESDHLRERSDLELAVLANLLNEDEILIKDFVSRTDFIPKTKDQIHLPSKFMQMAGELILTDERILFLFDYKEGKRVSYIRYVEMDDCFTSYNKKRIEEGLFIVVSQGRYYVFSGLLRFGLLQWEHYVKKRIKELLT